MKKGIALLLCLLMVMSLFGCGQKEVTPPKAENVPVKEDVPVEEKNPYEDLYIACVTEGVTMPFQKMCADSFVKFAEEKGIKYKTLDAESDAAKMVAILDQLMLEKPDALLVFLSTGAETALLQYNEAGIPVICVDKRPTLSDDLKDLDYYYVGADNYDMGVSWATYLADVLPENGNVCYLWSRFGAEIHILRNSGFKDTISKLRPDVTILDEQQSLADAATAMAKTEDWLQRFGAENVHAIVSSAGGAAQGAMEVLISKGLQDQIYICAPDLLSASNILSGGIDCDLLQDDAVYMKTALDTALALLEGQEIAEKEINVQCQVITKDNAGDYLALRP